MHGILRDMFRNISNFPTCVFFLVELWSNRGLPFLTSFVASTHLIRSGVGAIDSPDESRQGFEQYDTFEVLEKVFQSIF